MDEVVTYSSNVTKLTTEIRVIQDNVCQGMIEIGKRLIEIKKELGHGQWLPYIDKELGYSRRTASNFMKVAQEFGNGNFERLDINPSKMIALLDLQADSRDEFIDGVEIHSISVRELKNKIKETKKRKKIPSITIKSLSVRSSGRCEICSWGNEYMIGVLEAHHLEEYHETQDDSIDNLIMICPNCHSIIHTLNNCKDETIKSGIICGLDKNTYSNILKYIKQ